VISTRCGDQAMAAYLMQMLILPSTWQHSFPGSEYVTAATNDGVTLPAHVPQRLPSLAHGSGGGGGGDGGEGGLGGGGARGGTGGDGGGGDGGVNHSGWHSQLCSHTVLHCHPFPAVYVLYLRGGSGAVALGSVAWVSSWGVASRTLQGSGGCWGRWRVLGERRMLGEWRMLGQGSRLGARLVSRRGGPLGHRRQTA
jgi:hypothetical protein